MALNYSPSGVTIDTTAEIIAALAAAIKDPSVLGPSARPDDDATNLGRLVKTLAERESQGQQILLTILNGLDIDAATGYGLDTLAKLRGPVREEADFSESVDGLFTFSGAGTIPASRKVRNDRTGDDWETIADIVSPGAGTVAGTIRAVETGPKEFLGADTWTIVDSVANWSSFDTVGDIDPEDVGQDQEPDDDYRARSYQALLSNGNDVDAMIAAAAQVTGVSYAGGFANRTAATVDGVPSRAVEIVVEGGDPQEVREAIYTRLPPGTETFGAVSGTVTMENGDPLTVYYSTPVDVSIWLRITMTTGAEYDPPFDFETLVKNAVLAEAEADANPGVDVVPPAYQRVVWETTADTTTGRPTLVNVLVEGSTDGIIWSTAAIPLTHKQRPDFDTARVSTVVI